MKKHLDSIALFAVALFLVVHATMRKSTPAARQQDGSTPVTASAKPEITLRAHHPGIATITQFARDPDIVTPVGIAVAPDGRVFVQENHTHQRPGDYAGPKADRILVFTDTDGDGVADQRSIFYEGLVMSTGLRFGPDGHLYVSTRWFVGRFRDAATRHKAAADPEVLVKCDTKGDYPHNGVGGLAIDPANPQWMAFGFGENLGEAYTFVGSDGVKLSGGGEGGSTYRCRTDGSKLQRVSTGLWNAFGMTYDLDGNLFATDNDPNSTPPNRLLHIIPGADYGYEYRYGRSGRHPLVTWYGEFPGTLGMIGPLGEAACGVIPFGPNKLLTASWTDNRIDLHPLTPQGASFTAGREPFISGPDDFRPVHFAYAPDGKALYFTDWVKLSYPVHGQGRIWRVGFKQAVNLAPLPRQAVPVLAAQAALGKLGDADPYVRTAAIQVLTQQPQTLKAHDWKAAANAVARAHCAVALKRLDPNGQAAIIPDLLNDPDADVRFVGIKWIADANLTQYQAVLEQQLNRTDMSRRGLLGVVAALNKISGGSQGEFSPDGTLLRLAEDPAKPAAVRALALQSVALDHRALTVQKLAALAQAPDVALQREAIRSLALHQDPKRAPVLATLAANPMLAPDLRADAIAGLAAFASDHSALLTALADDTAPGVADEAKRTLVSAGLIQRTLKPQPPPNDLAGWEKLIAEAPGTADLAVGRRLFFHPRLGTCHNCHAMNGRGREVGPDLTTIRRQDGIDRQWLLKNILDPGAQVAPYFRPQQVTTKDGQVRLGFILGIEGETQGYVGPDGKIFNIRKVDVVKREEIAISLMPPGLLYPMSAGEIRDLTAYLLKGDEP